MTAVADEATIVRSGGLEFFHAIDARDLEGMIRIKEEHGDNLDVNWANGDGDTALHYVSWRGSAEMFRFVLTCGPNVNACDDCTWTPLMRATVANKVEFVRLLLQAGADWRIQNDNGHTALDLACERKFPEIIEVLRSAASPLLKSAFKA